MAKEWMLRDDTGDRQGFDSWLRGWFRVVYPDGLRVELNDGRRDEEADDRAHREDIDDVDSSLHWQTRW